MITSRSVARVRPTARMGHGRGSDRIWFPVSVFYLAASGFALAFSVIQSWTTLDPQILQCAQFGPAAAALLVMVIFGARVRRLVIVGSLHEGGRLVSALFAAAVTILAGASVVLSIVSQTDLSSRSGQLTASLIVIVPAQFLGACAEELGWRCTLLPLLRQKVGPLLASVVTGVMWGLWHPVVYSSGAVVAVSFVAGAVGLSIVLGLAVERIAGPRLLAAGLFHATINVGLLLLLHDLATTTDCVVFGASSVCVAMVAVVLDRRIAHG